MLSPLSALLPPRPCRPAAMIAIIWLSASGCSFLFTQGPPKGHEQMPAFACTGKETVPSLDLTWAAMLLIGVPVILADTSDKNRGARAAWNLSWSTTSVYAALVGRRRVRACQDARRLLAARQTPGGVVASPSTIVTPVGADSSARIAQAGAATRAPAIRAKFNYFGVTIGAAANFYPSSTKEYVDVFQRSENYVYGVPFAAEVTYRRALPNRKSMLGGAVSLSGNTYHAGTGPAANTQKSVPSDLTIITTLIGLSGVRSFGSTVDNGFFARGDAGVAIAAYRYPQFVYRVNESCTTTFENGVPRERCTVFSKELIGLSGTGGPSNTADGGGLGLLAGTGYRWFRPRGPSGVASVEYAYRSIRQRTFVQTITDRYTEIRAGQISSLSLKFGYSW